MTSEGVALRSPSSRLPLPAPPLILLPIGGIVAALLHRPPLVAGKGERLDVVAVEQDRQTLVGGHILGQVSALHEEADGGSVRVYGGQGDEDRLVRRVGLAV